MTPSLQRLSGTGGGGDGVAWARLAAIVSRHSAELSAPPPDARGLCWSCRGPVRQGHARCFQCEYHEAVLPGLLPDIVVPIAYAPKGSVLARSLWMYKSGAVAGQSGRRGPPGAPAADRARVLLGALLVTFLRRHLRCVIRAAGGGRPSHVAVVPSGRSRPGCHPLLAMAGSLVRLPQAELSLNDRDGTGARLVSVERYRAGRLAGADVLLLDDTWTTGASCCSAKGGGRTLGGRGRHRPSHRPRRAGPAPSRPRPGSGPGRRRNR